jgi:hypothetical protein
MQCDADTDASVFNMAHQEEDEWAGRRRATYPRPAPQELAPWFKSNNQVTVIWRFFSFFFPFFFILTLFRFPKIKNLGKQSGAPALHIAELLCSPLSFGAVGGAIFAL